MAQSLIPSGETNRPPTRSQLVEEGTSGAALINTNSVGPILEGGRHITSAEINELQDNSLHEAGQQPRIPPDPIDEEMAAGGTLYDVVAAAVGGEDEDLDEDDAGVEDDETGSEGEDTVTQAPNQTQTLGAGPMATGQLPPAPAPQAAAPMFGPPTLADLARGGSRPAADQMVAAAGLGPLPPTDTFDVNTANAYENVINFWHLGHGTWTLGLPPTGPGQPSRRRTGVKGPDAPGWIALHRQ